jgi:hypothetical protein
MKTRQLTFNNVKKWAKKHNIQVEKGRTSTEYLFWDIDDHSMTGVAYSVLELYEDIISEMLSKGIKSLPM